MNIQENDTRYVEALLNLSAACGLGFIGVGLWLIYPPAALITVGAILLAGALLAARGG